MKIKLLSIPVADQDKALKFYTGVLGFVKKQEFPAGDYKWITVVSPDEPDGIELSLEPNVTPFVKTFQETLYKQGIPYTAFNVDDVGKEFDRLSELGVIFRKKPIVEYGQTVAIFDDTCGNFIQIEHGE